MSPYYRRKKPGARENAGAALAALGLAAGVAAVTFYLVRLVLSREYLGFNRVPEALPPTAAGPGLEAEGTPTSSSITD